MSSRYINSGTKLQLETHFRKMILDVLYVSESTKLIKKGKNFQAIFKVASVFSILKVS